MNRRVLEVVVEEAPSERPSAVPEDSVLRSRAQPRASASAMASARARVAAMLESDADDSELETDGDPTAIRSRREAQELREYLLHEAELREERLLEEARLREEARCEEELREQDRRVLQLREERLREALMASDGQPTRESPRAPPASASADDAALFGLGDETAIVSPGRARGRSWLLWSALGVAVAVAGAVVLFGGQSSRRAVAVPAPSKAPPIVGQRASQAGGEVAPPALAGLVIPTMRLDLAAEGEKAEALPAGQPEAEQAASVSVRAAPGAAVPIAPSVPSPQDGPVPGGDPALLLARAEALLRGDRGPAGALQAKQLLDQAVAQQRDNPHAQAALAEACLRLRDAACARAAATRAVRLRPKREAYLRLEAKVQEAFPTP